MAVLADGTARSTMDDPLRAHTPRELAFFLEVVPCARCGRGPLEVGERRGGGVPHPGEPEAIRTRCHSCKAQRTFHVEWTDASPDQPSEIVDLAQWVGLYFQYADRMDKAPAPADARDAATRAAACLAEALKFYGDDEMPPESAFWADPSREAFDSNPAMFARTHLRELRAMLPVAGAAAERPGHNRKTWWKLWR